MFQTGRDVIMYDTPQANANATASTIPVAASALRAPDDASRFTSSAYTAMQTASRPSSKASRKMPAVG